MARFLSRATCARRVSVIVNKKGTTLPEQHCCLQWSNRELRDEGPMLHVPDKAIVGNAARDSGGARIAAGFVAGCAHIADAGAGRRSRDIRSRIPRKTWSGAS